MIYGDISKLVGNTPTVKVSRFCAAHGVQSGVDVLCKLEYFNPAGSVKDRVALAMLDDAEARGLISAGATIIEPTSGNTGVGLAAIAASRGYRAIFTMPETMSIERRKLLAAYGAEVVLTDGAKGMRGAIDKANELAATMENSFIPSQFDNPVNPRAHFDTTGPELLRDTDGRLDIFVAGVGTGGTVSGTGGFLKSRLPNVKVVAVEPQRSPVLSGGAAGAHGIQGIGAGFVPKNFDASVVDEVFAVTDDAALDTMRELARLEGLLVGISSGAALFAACEIAKRAGSRGKTIVALLPDGGERYLSIIKN